MALQILLSCLAAGGLIGLLLELKAPRLVIPALAGLVCLVAFFGLQADDGAVVWLAAALFVLGLFLIGVEVALLPGHGFAAAFGLVLALAGLALAGAESVPETTAEWQEFTGRFLRYGLAGAAA